MAEVTVTDDDDASVTDSVEITASNAAPTEVDAGADQTADEGEEVHLFGYGIDPGSADTLSWAWEAKAGTVLIATGNEQDFSFTPADNGLYTITLTATDAEGAYTTDEVSVTVNNVNPFIWAGDVPFTVSPADGLVLAPSITDPGSDESLWWSYDWGDGTADTLPAGSSTDPHHYGVEYADDLYNNYDLSGRTVTLTAHDKGGGTSTDQYTLAVDYLNDFDGGELGGWSGSVMTVPILYSSGDAHLLGASGNGSYATFFGSETRTFSLSGLVAHDALTLEFDLVQIGQWAQTAAWSGSNLALTVDGNSVAPSNVADLGPSEYAMHFDNGTTYPCDPGTYATHTYRLSYNFVHGASSVAIAAAVSGLNDGLGGVAYKEQWAVENVRLRAGRVDLVIDGLPEQGRNGADEMDAGGYVPVNQPDPQVAIPPMAELTPLAINLPPNLPSATEVILSISSGPASAISVWNYTSSTARNFLVGKETESSTPQTEVSWTIGTDTVPGTVYVQGLADTGSSFEFTLILAASGQSPAPPASPEKVNGHAVAVDLDIDSNNDNDLELPDASRTDAEDAVEDVENDASHPGKIIFVNSNDDDNDGITDYDDVFNPSEHFVPITVTLGPSVDLNTFSIEFKYQEDRPFLTQHNGNLRIWTHDGNNDRDNDPFYYRRTAQAGWSMFVPSGKYSDIRADKLGFSEETRKLTFWVEATRPSQHPGDISIEIVVDPDGNGAAPTISDKVRITSMKFGWVDKISDYALSSDEDSDNYFLHESNDWRNLDLYYELEGPNALVSNVGINVYPGIGTTPITSLSGAKDAGGQFRSDGKQHVLWDSVTNANGTWRGIGFFPLELVVTLQPLAQPVRTPISDADATKPPTEQVLGWQSRQDGLAVHDLLVKHSPTVFVKATDCPPTDPLFFAQRSALMQRLSGDYAVWIASNPTAQQLATHSGPEFFLDRDGDGEKHWGQQQPTVPIGYFTAVPPNSSAHPNTAFLQYWLFYDHSESAFDLAASPWHEGDVEFVQAAVNTFDRQQPNMKSAWFIPIAATAAQHYYGQTVKWDLQNGGRAPSPQEQTWVQHDAVNEHFYVFVANGTHATYFRDGAFLTKRSGKLGTAVQYSKSLFGAAFETAYATPIPGMSWESPAIEFLEWEGRWGMKASSLDAPFNMEARDGPFGIPKRFQVNKNGAQVFLRTMPKEFHNAALRPGDPDKLKLVVT